MTDSRLRGEWLGAMRFDDLSDTAWRVFTSALQWCNENGTDGKVPKRYLRLLHPDGEQPAAFEEIELALLWTQSTKGDYVFHDWEGELGQNSAATVAAYREGSRLRSKKFRDAQRKRLESKNAPRPITRDATDDETSDATAHVTRPKTRDVGRGEEEVEVEVEDRGPSTATISESGRSPRVIGQVA